MGGEEGVRACVRKYILYIFFLVLLLTLTSVRGGECIIVVDWFNVFFLPEKEKQTQS